MIYVKNFETLLRWIFDKPLYIMPEIGKPPEFLNESNAISLGTASVFKRLIDAFKNDKSYKHGTLNEYLETFSKNLEKFRIQEHEGEIDDAIISNIESFIPHRNEFIQLLSVINQYSPKSESVHQIHAFFESLTDYFYAPEGGPSGGYTCRFDNFKFIIHKLFLYTIAIFIYYEHFDLADYLLEERYYIKDYRRTDSGTLANYSEFRTPLESLSHRNTRLDLGRLSLRADLLKERCVGTKIDFILLMQADFVLYMKTFQLRMWWPETLMFSERNDGSFEIFTRAISKRYFTKIKGMLGVESVAELTEKLDTFSSEGKSHPSWDFHSVKPRTLLGIVQLASIP